MGVPKSRITRMRGRRRRTHWKPDYVSAVLCPQCGELRLPHRACLNCGTYNGEVVLEIKKKEKKEGEK